MDEKENINMEKPKKENKVLNFFITTLNGMAYGLFATLIIGTIIATIGQLFLKGNNGVCQLIGKALGDGKSGASFVLQVLTGAGIGVGIALTLKLNPLDTIVIGGVGEIAAYFSLSTKFVTANVYSDAIKVGDPLTVYIVCIIVAVLMKLVFRKKTPVDILIIPLFGIIVGTIFSMLVRYPLIYVTYGIQWLVNYGTNAVPLIMGAVVAVLMGMALTAPISSAAIAAMVFNLGSVPLSEAINMPEYSGLILASGAAIVGCSCQMVGFAVQSRKDNPIGMVISIGIGTSMLQFKNILKKPIIWLPTIIVSAILGPVSTMWLKLICMGSSAGMGTAGLVGQIGTFSSMGNTWQTWIGIFGLQIILPGVLVFLVDLLFRKLHLINDGDLTV
ncbi:MAG: PTS sugar transporter subunit IIC [Bacilli bacterium]|nr:PTS sugar transporter subunit IIC [Bacilli bacterium]